MVLVGARSLRSLVSTLALTFMVSNSNAEIFVNFLGAPLCEVSVLQQYGIRNLQERWDRVMDAIPFVLMRGGTSKCVMFRESDLPIPGPARDLTLLRAFGSPDARQIDGIGGATSTTSKACIIGPPSRTGCDVDYTFAQVSITESRVDYGGNCGNCSSAVGPYAIEAGFMKADGACTTVRIFNTNTQKVISAEVPTASGHPQYEGTYHIAGVPGGGAPQRLWFEDPGGSMTGSLLPTGNAVDIVDTELASIAVSIVDAANPVIFVKAHDLGLSGIELPAAIDSRPELLLQLEQIRGQASVLMGFVDKPEHAAAFSRAVPKIAMVVPPTTYADNTGRTVPGDRQDFTARIMSMGKLHPAYALTGAIATGSAARIPGTVVYDCRAVHRREMSDIHIGHPTGIIDVDIDAQIEPGQPSRIIRAAGYRTARKIAEGVLFVD